MRREAGCDGALVGGVARGGPGSELPRLWARHVRLDRKLEERVAEDWDLKAAVRAMWVVGRGEVEEEIGLAFEYAALGSWRDGDGRFAEALLRYVMSGKMKMRPEGLVELVARALRPRGEQAMTTYIEHFMEQGYRRGRQEGWQEGLRASRRAVLGLLERRLGSVPAEVRDRLEAIDDVETLEALILVAGTCADLEEFLEQMPQ